MVHTCSCSAWNYSTCNSSTCQYLLVSVVRGICLLVSVLLAGELDCRRTVAGLDYVGKVNTTVTGRTCVAWSSQVTGWLFIRLLKGFRHDNHDT